MELTSKETELINKLRTIKKNAGFEEVVVILKYVPVGEDEYIQQVLPGKATSMLRIRLQMKKLLDDFDTINQTSSHYTITYDPGLLRIFQH